MLPVHDYMGKEAIGNLGEANSLLTRLVWPLLATYVACVSGWLVD